MPDENPQELTPEERLVAAEGQELERRVKEMKGDTEPEHSMILGSDGQPVEKDVKVEGAGEQTPVVDEKELARQALQSAKKKVAERAEAITAILDKSPVARSASEAVYSAYKLLFFALNDLGTFKGMTNELLEQLSDSMRAASLQRGINVHDLRSEMLGGKRKLKGGGKAEYGVVPYLNYRIQYYASEGRKREAKISEIKRRIGDNGIALPCHSLTSLYKDTKFNAGSVLVLHGSERAVRMALRHCAFTHQIKNGGEPFYLSAAREQQDWDGAFTIMPVAWWENAASSDHRLIETFQPIVDSKSVLLVMEGLTHLWNPETMFELDEERRSRALSKLYQWASENMVAVIVGDFVEGPVEESMYGGIPHVACTVAKVAAGDEEEKLFIGNDPLSLISEE